MKNIIYFLLIILCSCAATKKVPAQGVPLPFRRSSSAVTALDSRSGALLNFKIPNTTDTTLNGGLDSLGQFINVISGAKKGVWYRDSVNTGGHKWTLLGNSVAAGSDTYVQFNDGSIFGATSGLTFNKSTNVLTVASGGKYAFGSRGGITATADGQFQLNNNAANGFSRLAFGGQTTSFPELKVNSNDLQVKLADESDWTFIHAKTASLGDSTNKLATTAFVLQNRGGGGGGGVYNFNLPLTVSGSNVSVQDAIADGLTKGTATYTASDFNTVSGLVSIDYSNGQIVSGSVNGFVTPALKSTWDGKQDALPSQTGNAGKFLTTNGSVLSWAAVSGSGTLTNLTASNSGGFTWTITNPTTTPNISAVLQNAVADGSTKGQASFAASDFNAASGNITIDYVNGQIATVSQNGFLSSTLKSTYDAKQDAATGAVTTVMNSNLTASKVAVSDVNGKFASSAVSATELNSLIGSSYQTLTDGATITWNIASGSYAAVTLAGNRTLSISNTNNIRTGILVVKQDATGSRNITLPAGSKVLYGFGSGTTIQLSQTANTIDIISWYYDTNTSTYYWTLGKNFQ